MVSPDTGNPCRCGLKPLLERSDLTDFATLIGMALPKSLAELSCLFLWSYVWVQPFDQQSVTPLNYVNEFVRFGKEKIRVECENGKRRTDSSREIDQDHIFRAEA